MSRRSPGEQDPAAAMRAPVEAALGRLTLRATGTFAVCVVAMAAPIVLRLDEGTTLLVRHLVPALLVADILLYALRRAWARGRTAGQAGDPSPLEEVWAVDPADTRLALAMILVAGAAVILALVVLAFPYLRDADDRAIVIGICLPGGGILCFLAALSWVGETGQVVSRSLAETHARLRAYWAAVAERTAEREGRGR